MLHPVKNSLSFKAIYQLKGTKEEQKNFGNFIKKEVAKTHMPDAPVKIYSHKDSIIVLTSGDTVLVKNSPKLSDYLKETKWRIFNADNFYDKNKKELMPQVIDFLPLSQGDYKEIIPRTDGEITGYYLKFYIGNRGQIGNNGKVIRLDFNTPVNLLKACDVAGEKLRKASYDFEVFKKAIKKDKKLRDLKVKGIAGAGFSSVVFNIDDKKVLKLSCSPCYPKKMEPFDLPIYDKGYIPSDRGFVYYCIQPKAQNSSETNITPKQVDQVISQIEKSGYKPDTDDLNSLMTRQIVIFEGKPYLCDYDCARYSDGENRLFRAKRSIGKKLLNFIKI